MSHMVTVKADDRRRIQIPNIKPGQIFALENNGDGTIMLTYIKPTVRKRSILDGLKPFTKEECERCWGPGSEDSEMDALYAHLAKLPPPPPDFEK